MKLFFFLSLFVSFSLSAKDYIASCAMSTLQFNEGIVYDANTYNMDHNLLFSKANEICRRYRMDASLDYKDRDGESVPRYTIERDGKAYFECYDKEKFEVTISLSYEQENNLKSLNDDFYSKKQKYLNHINSRQPSKVGTKTSDSVGDQLLSEAHEARRRRNTFIQEITILKCKSLDSRYCDDSLLKNYSTKYCAFLPLEYL